MRLLLILLLAGIATVQARVADMARPVAIVIHGGAGTILRENLTAEIEAAYREKLSEAVRAGHDVLEAGGSSREAVIAAIRVMEDSPLFNAGKGAVFTHEEKVELDASIMEGRTLNAGAITGVTRARNPIRLANAVLEHSPHVMLMGEGAEAFAAEQGIELVDNDYFYTDRRLEQLRKVKQADDKTALSEDDDLGRALDDKQLGTVGAVAIDRRGDIAAGTSTGGMTNKRFGRIGDSPIIGAGTYADNGVCGISATGHGEYFIRAAVAHDIRARVEYKGIALQQAADEVVMEKLRAMGADGGIIGLDASGNVVYSFNSAGMYRASIDTDGRESVAIFR
ncbi:MAG: isoaspartyl peptidase/L-asparaginase [Gammaproteobacteria bacterium]|nr:isoaspartyl peptidase/L-asparaginase [Gammaproteobacteria bacterium]